MAWLIVYTFAVISSLCQSPLTIKHSLLNCVDFMALRQQFYIAYGMHGLFIKVKQENTLTFLTAAGHLIFIKK